MASARRPLVRAMEVLAVIALLVLATSCTAEEDFTDLERFCQNVQCPTECPPDSYLQSPLDIGYGEYDETDSNERVRRAIAMNNHAHGPIKIVPSSYQFPNNVQRQVRHLQKRDLTQNQRVLQHLCCPKCTCHPCQEQASSCPPDTKQIVLAINGPSGQPGSCCPVVHCDAEEEYKRLCFSDQYNAYFPNNSTWKEGKCAACRCEAGMRNCEMSSCKPLNCEHKLELPDTCCPVCDPSKSIFCEEHNCDIHCRNGYERRVDGCALCKCLRLPVVVTVPAVPSTAETIEVSVANFTSDSLDVNEGNTVQDVKEPNGEYLSDLMKVVGIAGILILIAVCVSVIYRLVTVESMKKWLKLLFRCNQLPQRKTAYNRVSSNAPPATPAAATGVVAQGNNGSLA